MSACSSCGARIIWRNSETTGKPMPIDSGPVPDGNVVLNGNKAAVLGPLELAVTDQPRYKSHFATCPNAGQHRKTT